MIDITFYNITKRLKSTARPTGSGIVYSCVLKENTSILEPDLKLQLSTKPDYNYFKLDNRYYWITGIISLANNLWQISGRVDVLATFKGHINNTSAFVLYDSTPNTQLPDTRLGIETDCATYVNSVNMPWNFRSGEGTYFIATTGDTDDFNLNGDPNTPSTVFQNDAKLGSGVYIVDKAKIGQIGFDVEDFAMVIARAWDAYKTQVNNDIAIIENALTADIIQLTKEVWRAAAYIARDSIGVFADTMKTVVKNLMGGGSAMENIKASYWLPFEIPSTAWHTDNRPLALGTYTDTITGLKVVDDAIISIGLPIDIPWHFTDWRNTVCTEVFLYIPLIGCIAIPSEVVKGTTSLNVKFSLNLYSGAMAVEVSSNGGQIGTYGSNTGMPFLIGESNINLGAMFNTVVNAAAQNYAGAVMSGMGAMTGMATSVGGIGGGAGVELTNTINCICRVHNTSQEPSALLATIGTPTNQLKTLSGTGYCQTMNAQMSGAAVTGEPDPTATELIEVNNYLDSGVYLE